MRKVKYSAEVSDGQERPAIQFRTDGFRSALLLALIFAAVKLALHVFANMWQAHLGWGYFRDEPYYILCGQYLDWGYVDHTPLVALQAKMAVLLFGKSLAGIRFFSSLAGALKVLLCGLLAWQLGAHRTGQALAMLAALVCAAFMAVDSFLSMNAFEPVFWTAAAMALLRVIQMGGEKGSTRWWLVFGVAAGLGCENKPSMVFFLAALLLALLVTPQRRILFTRGMAAGVAVALLLVTPNLLWQAHHQWATLQFLENARATRRLATPSVFRFFAGQIATLGPFCLPVAGAGLYWLFFDKKASACRFLGYTFVFFLCGMMLMRDQGKEYYVTPVYPLLFAAGGVVLERYMVAGRRWMLPVYITLLVLSGVVEIPAILVTETPEQWIVAECVLHLRSPAAIRAQPMPDFSAMRFGWQELADQVTQIYQSLSPADRVRAGIYTSDYGTSSAINFLGAGRGLPFAISGHNNYFLWGPHGETGAVMIVVSTETREQLLHEYKTVEVRGPMMHPYAMKWGFTVYLCRDRKASLVADWPSKKHYS